MDEATNANDEDTEQLVFEGLRRSLPDITMLVVSHRLSTLKFCDRVFVLSDGNLHQVSDLKKYFDQLNHGEIFQLS